MRQEDKDLLIQDLCARLPYGVKIKTSYNKMDEPIELRFVNPRNESFAIGSNFTLISGLDFDTYECKPYLFPLSSMTEEQIEEAKTYFWKDVDYGKNLVDKGINCFYPCFNILEFYHKYHIDYRGLIPMGLAIDCTNLNIY